MLNRRPRVVCPAYVLHNQVTHIRFLPAASRHSFVYPTFCLLVSLNALENGELDLLGGWLFSYGGLWGRVTGLRASAYLFDNPNDNRSIKCKLIDILNQHGHPGHDLQDAWLMTMPSFLGFEGINPLSVYYCYKHNSTALWIVVLEVHNTFGERHVYILETGRNEQTPTGKFDHQWIFPRQFHVSPFNDRSGYYICQLKAPTPPPSTRKGLVLPSPRPVIKVSIMTALPNTTKKIVAILRTTESVPLSKVSLLSALVRAPLGLLATLTRIVYQAYRLHYHKNLDVYQRPEPRAVDPAVESCLPVAPNAVQNDTNHTGRGVGWQKKGFLEHWCEQRIHAFLHKKCAEVNVSVTFVSTNPVEERTTISPSNMEGGQTLTIYYRSPRVFTIIFMMPSPRHALLYGMQAEKVFTVSSDMLFNLIFAAPSSAPSHRVLTHLARCVRKGLVPDSLDVPVPRYHAVDAPMTFTLILFLVILSVLVTLEEKLFKAFGVRFVRGGEPWGGWSRLSMPSNGDFLGSVGRDNLQ